MHGMVTEMVARKTNAAEITSAMPPKWGKTITSVQSTVSGTPTNLATSPMGHIRWKYRRMCLKQLPFSTTYNYSPSLRNRSLRFLAQWLVHWHCRWDASHYVAVNTCMRPSIDHVLVFPSTYVACPLAISATQYALTYPHLTLTVHVMNWTNSIVWRDNTPAIMNSSGTKCK